MPFPDAKRGRKTLLLMFALSLTPILAAQAVYTWYRPAGGQSFGELLVQPAVLDAAKQWRLVAHDPAGCTAQADALTFAARQLDVAQGRESDRVAYAATRLCPGKVADAQVVQPRQALPGAGLYLVDPNGNAVIRYSPQQLASDEGRRRVMSEIGKLLKNNQALG
ncbi:hypothetical protein [Chitinolyticbacter meiyuanensis]|uniref:hypothetical protein n=1 Tax=Chitinolyticbacter meiyuanensis TaxID=682798 RepID=UPI0011E5F522|nr:hypothetical protein [Chitinolyticbacter meiyuanensis]